MNTNLLNQTRRTRDSAKKAAYRNQRDSLPRVRKQDLADGMYRLRIWPSNPDKNPHGYLDYRMHTVPQDFPNLEGIDPQPVSMVCPRSSNWDPMPLDGDSEYTHRCLCCELDALAFDEDEFGNTIMDTLDDGLQEVIKMMDYRGNWQSGVYLPVTMCARIHTQTQETSSNGKTYTNTTYMPAGVDSMIGMQLQLRQPDFGMKFDRDTGQWVRARNGLEEQLFDILAAVPDIGDLITGRWLSLTKINGGKGAGGYSIAVDPNCSPFAESHVDYKKIYAFPKWGDKTSKKPSQRLPFAQQEAIISNAKWARSWREFGLPITDADADILDQGGTLSAPAPAYQQAVYAPATPPPVPGAPPNVPMHPGMLPYVQPNQLG